MPPYLVFVIGLIVLVPLVVLATARLQARVDRWFARRALRDAADVDLDGARWTVYLN